jgi:hypothetical protein
MGETVATYHAEDEFVGIKLKDKRLEDRFIRTMRTLFRVPSRSIWAASVDNAESKGIYRFLANPRLDVGLIKGRHVGKTIERARASGGVVLAIQDTTALNYSGQKKMEGLGRNCEHGLGINLHTCMAVTAEGVALGILSQSASTRTEERVAGGKKCGQDYIPIEEKESQRWLETMREVSKLLPEGQEALHVCDREGDMYELFDEAEKSGQKFLIRATHNRRIEKEKGEKGYRHIQDEIRKSPLRREVMARLGRDPRRKMKARTVKLEIRYDSYEVKRPTILSPARETVAKTVVMSVIYVREAGNPEGVEWYLLTNCLIDSADAAERMVGYYLQRWKIEEFHHVLKSGCMVEKLQESTVDRTSILVYLYSVISVFIMNLTYSARVAPELPCDALFAEEDWKLLYRLGNKTKKSPTKPYSIKDAVMYISRLGGPKRSPSAPSPGVKTIWQGMAAFSLLCYYRDFCGSS